jgi:uncharacterized OsmC-like protein
LGSGGDGPTVRCTWTMSEEPPWRVASIAIDVQLPSSTTEARVEAVRRAIGHCTVHNSLQSSPAISIRAAVAPSEAESPHLTRVL